MSKPIITSVRHLSQLRGSLLLTAIEIAHRANSRNGICFMSYTYIASKTHQSRRTAMRHVKRLLELGILRCQRFWGPHRLWGVNKYVFCIPWEKPTAFPPHTHSGDTSSLKFPVRQQEEKYGRVADVQKGQDKVLSWLTPGSLAWQAAQESCGM